MGGTKRLYCNMRKPTVNHKRSKLRGSTGRKRGLARICVIRIARRRCCVVELLPWWVFLDRLDGGRVEAPEFPHSGRLFNPAGPMAVGHRHGSRSEWHEVGKEILEKKGPMFVVCSVCCELPGWYRRAPVFSIEAKEIHRMNLW